jgi:serine/threonine protein kinase/tetratricopeptide (TPR) repeat protein
MQRLTACPGCGAKFDVSAMRVGQRFRCGACGKVLIVPPPRPAGRSSSRPGEIPRTEKASRSGSRSGPLSRRGSGASRGGAPRPAEKKSKPVAPSRSGSAKKEDEDPLRETRVSGPISVAEKTPPPEREAALPPPTPQPPKDRLIGQTVKGVFTIERKLGEGGYGIVYRAFDKTLQRPVALKVMLPRLTANPEFVGKFRREARMAAALMHPNIVSIHDVGFDRGLNLHFLAMEFVDGRPLTDILEERGPLAPQEAIDIVLQATNGLGAAHGKSIVHRDIKPGNLMITERGVVKVTDFGLAKVSDPDDNTSTIIGSPNYMPPEQFEGKAKDGRSDIYSLGITFYLMLTNRRPFDGASPAEILRNIMTKTPEALSSYVSGLPGELERIILRMIHRNVDERYADVREVARDLRRLYSLETGGERIFCPTCGTPNAFGARRCGECGHSLTAACPKCDFEDFIGVKFCGNCGCNIDEEKEFAEILAEGRELRTTGCPDRALEKFRQLSEMRPDDEEVRVALEFVERESATLDKNRSAVRKAMDAADLDRAGDLLEKALEKFPGDPDLRAAEEALADQLRLRRIQSCLASARDSLGERRYETALASVEEAAAAGAPADDVDGIREEALSALDRLEEIAARARDLEAGGSVAASMAEWNRAIEISPTWTPAVEAIRTHRERLDRVAAARAKAREALERGDLAPARAAALEALEVIADDEEARAVLGEVVRAETVVLEGLSAALAHLANGSLAEALRAVRKLRESYPHYPDLEPLARHVEGLLGATEFFRRFAATSEENGRHELTGTLARVLARLEGQVAAPKPTDERAEHQAEVRRRLIGRARQQLEAREFSAAMDELRPLAETHPGDTDIQELCEAARRGLETERRERNRRLVAKLNQALRAARESLRRGDLEKAEQAMAQAEKIAPDRPEVKALRREIEETTEREQMVEKTAFFNLEDLRRMAKEGR